VLKASQPENARNGYSFLLTCIFQKYTIYIMDKIIISEYEGFDWDDGNRRKSEIKHNVSSFECEQLFSNKPILLQEDVQHSTSEKRFIALGATNSNRKLFIAFTIRKKMIRVISARPASKREVKIYEQAKKDSNI
jgi:hypothetical protein